MFMGSGASMRSQWVIQLHTEGGFYSERALNGSNHVKKGLEAAIMPI